MSHLVALLDSAGVECDAARCARFSGGEGEVRQLDCVPDPTGHGGRIAAILRGAAPQAELLLGQVFDTPGAATPAAVAAAIDWAVGHRARLIHMSLGLAADRPVLAHAVTRALAAGCVLVAATPARGGVAYPAAYAGVIRATGDARCAPGEVSVLGADIFGGCPHAGDAATRAGGASIGAAHVSAALLRAGMPPTRESAAAALARIARYHGREHRTASDGEPRSRL